MGRRVPKARLRDRRPAHHQTFLTVESEQLLVVHFKTFSGQQDAQTTIAEPTPFVRQFPKPFAQGFIAPILLLILKDRPMQVRQFTRPSRQICFANRLSGNGRSDKPCRSITSRTARRFTCPAWASDRWRPHAEPSVVFCCEVLQGSIVEHRIRQHALQPVVLVFQGTQLLGI